MLANWEKFTFAETERVAHFTINNAGNVGAEPFGQEGQSEQPPAGFGGHATHSATDPWTVIRAWRRRGAIYRRVNVAAAANCVLRGQLSEIWDAAVCARSEIRNIITGKHIISTQKKEKEPSAYKA